MKKQSGFTLIELAIVLVIIGLLLGGVLKGQELITQAKIKNVIADFSGTTVAYYGYQDRYKAIPGDDLNATSRWGATIPSGNGNGSLAGNYNDNVNAPAATDETSLFWLHLRQSGFVGGSGGQDPTNAFSGMLGVQAGGDALRTAVATAGSGFTGLIICSANIADKAAVAIDTQLDDGVPNTGTVRAVTQTTSNPVLVPGSAADTTYTETGGKQYLVCKTL